MPEEAGRHRIYWQGKKMNPDGKEISQSRRTERGEEQRPVQKGELVCASEQNGLGGEKTSQHLAYPGKPAKRPQVTRKCEALKSCTSGRNLKHEENEDVTAFK